VLFQTQHDLVNRKEKFGDGEEESITRSRFSLLPSFHHLRLSPSPTPLVACDEVMSLAWC